MKLNSVPVKIVVAAAAVAVLALINIGYSKVFSTRQSFWLNAVKNTPDYAKVQQNLACMLFDAGDIQGAEKASIRALELDPKEPNVHNILAAIHMRSGRFDEALRELELENKGAENPVSYLNMAMIHINSGKTDKAEAALDRCRALKPDERYLNYLYGLVYLSKKDQDAAAVHFKKELVIDPGNNTVRELLFKISR